MGIDKLIKVIEALRGKNGCPWDKKQTPRSMQVYLIEEIYELIEAIESGTPDDVCEELGDVLFHILFITKLFEEMGHFDIKDVSGSITDKMTRRHPHVFGNEKVENTDDLRKRWNKIKGKEPNHQQNKSIIDSVPSNIPALMKAYRISERVGRVGFDWDNLSDVICKVEEEWSELKKELIDSNGSEKNRDNLALEFGDMIFTLVNVARFVRIHPETALGDSVRKFEKRFKYMEKIILQKQGSLDSVTQEDMEKLWEEAKKFF